MRITPKPSPPGGRPHLSATSTGHPRVPFFILEHLMTNTAVAPAGSDPIPSLALIAIYHLDQDGKTHAGTFKGSEAELAEKAARLMSYGCCRLPLPSTLNWPSSCPRAAFSPAARLSSLSSRRRCTTSCALWAGYPFCRTPRSRAEQADSSEGYADAPPSTPWRRAPPPRPRSPASPPPTRPGECSSLRAEGSNYV